MGTKPPILYGDHTAAPTANLPARQKLTGSVYLGIGSILVGGGGMLWGAFFWNGGVFVTGVVAGGTLGIIAAIWGLVNFLIGLFRKRAKAPAAHQAPPSVITPSLATITTPTHTTTPAHEHTPNRTGGWLAFLLGGGSIAAIILTLIVIVGLVIFAGKLFIYLLPYILPKGGAMNL